MFENLFTTQNLIALLTLTTLEIVLGGDNLVMLAVVSSQLTGKARRNAQRLGLAGAMVTRILFLCGISWLAGAKEPLLTVFGHGVSVRDLVMLLGGIFLVYKSAKEMHEEMAVGNGHHDGGNGPKAPASFGQVVLTIVVLDIVFSIDSVVTAVGMANNLPVMIGAIICAMIVMQVAAGWVTEFINGHPTVKMLALSFLFAIAVMLIADGCGQEVNKAYLYVAMAFAAGVEVLNTRAGHHRHHHKTS